MGYIPQTFIEDLLVRIDIVDVINARIPLKKSGRNYMACCPFHHEKTPSFSVVPDKQFFNCFGCGAAGSAVKFVMLFDNLEFKDAVEKLASQLGIALPEENNSVQSQQANSRYQQYLDILKVVTEYYCKNLSGNKIAQNYLTNRGISSEIAKDFILGYAPDGWDNLKSLFNNNAQNKLEDVGLWIRKENSHKSAGYDRFRNRLMFPIRDYKGKVIAFGGRVLDDSKPKYLNSPETLLFHKSAELYGLYEALSYSQKYKTKINKFVIVEGYLDVISLFQSGINYAVAALGTASSYRHLAKLFKYSHEIIFCFDGDQAGRKAAWRALENSLSSLYDGRVIKFLFLPEHHDPDSYIREHGKHHFEQVMDKALSITEFLFQHQKKYIKTEYNLDIDFDQNASVSIEAKVNFAKSCMPLINKVPDGAYKTILKSELAKICQVEVHSLEQMLELDLSKSSNTAGHKTDINYSESTGLHNRAVLGSQGLSSNLNLSNKSPLWRRACLLLVHDTSLVQSISDKFYSIIYSNNAGTSQHVKAAEIFKFISYGLKKYKNIPEFIDNISDQESYYKNIIIKLLEVEPMITDEQAAVEFNDILNKIIKGQLDSEMDSLKLKVETSGMTSLTPEEKQKLQELLLDKS